MLKGINRNMIVVRTPPTSRFEVAYFILRKERKTGADSRRLSFDEVGQMIREGEDGKKEKRRGLVYALWFTFGSVAGAGIGVLACMLFH